MRLAGAVLLALSLGLPAQAQAQLGQMRVNPDLPVLKHVPQANTLPRRVFNEAQARAFVARQEKAWNAGDLDRYFAGYEPEAVFTDQARTGSRIVPYGTATLPQAKAQARRFFAKAKVAEAGTIVRIELRGGGRGGTVRSNVVSRITRGGKTENTCIERVQTIVLVRASITSTGQTDTIYRCRRRP